MYMYILVYVCMYVCMYVLKTNLFYSCLFHYFVFAYLPLLQEYRVDALRWTTYIPHWVGAWPWGLSHMVSVDLNVCCVLFSFVDQLSMFFLIYIYINYDVLLVKMNLISMFIIIDFHYFVWACTDVLVLFVK